MRQVCFKKQAADALSVLPTNRYDTTDLRSSLLVLRVMPAVKDNDAKKNRKELHIISKALHSTESRLPAVSSTSSASTHLLNPKHSIFSPINPKTHCVAGLGHLLKHQPPTILTTTTNSSFRLLQWMERYKNSSPDHNSQDAYRCITTPNWLSTQQTAEYMARCDGR